MCVFGFLFAEVSALGTWNRSSRIGAPHPDRSTQRGSGSWRADGAYDSESGSPVISEFHSINQNANKYLSCMFYL